MRLHPLPLVGHQPHSRTWSSISAWKNISLAKLPMLENEVRKEITDSKFLWQFVCWNHPSFKQTVFCLKNLLKAFLFQCQTVGFFRKPRTNQHEKGDSPWFHYTEKTTELWESAPCPSPSRNPWGLQAVDGTRSLAAVNVDIILYALRYVYISLKQLGIRENSFDSKILNIGSWHKFEISWWISTLRRVESSILTLLLANCPATGPFENHGSGPVSEVLLCNSKRDFCRHILGSNCVATCLLQNLKYTVACMVKTECLLNSQHPEVGVLSAWWWWSFLTHSDTYWDDLFTWIGSRARAPFPKTTSWTQFPIFQFCPIQN